MSEQTTLFKLPYNRFLMQRMEFVVMCGDHLAANILRVIEAEIMKRKDAWEKRAEKAIEEKKPLPKKPKIWWARLSQSQIIARLYMYDSAKLKKPESEDLNSPEWVEYRFKKALSISKATLKKAIELLKNLGFLIEKSQEGDEFGAPIYTLNQKNIQEAINKLPADPFTIFHHLGGVENFESGGDSKNFNVPPQNFESGESQKSEVPPEEFSPGESQNFEVDIDSSIDTPSDTEIDNEEEGTYSEHDHDADTGSLHSPTPALQCHLCFEEAEARCPACNQWTCFSHRQTWLPGSAHPLLVDAAVCDACAKRYETEVRTRRTTPTPAHSHDSYSHSPTEGHDGDSHTHCAEPAAAHSDGAASLVDEPAEQSGRHTRGTRQAEQGARTEAGSQAKVQQEAVTNSNGYENDDDCAPTEPRVRAVKPVREAQPEQQFSTGRNIYPQQSAKVEPKAEQDALIARPDKPEMPLPSARWCAETAVLVSEALRGKYYTEGQQQNQVNAARRMFHDFKDITRSQFEEIFTDWAKWWKEHDMGIFTLAALLARGKDHEVRLQTALDKLEARANKAQQQPRGTVSGSQRLDVKPKNDNHMLYSDEELREQSDIVWARMQARLASPEVQAKLAAKGIYQ